MSTPSFRKHIFGHAFTGAWGHNKPLITIAILIAELRKDVIFTIFTDIFLYPKMIGELAKLPQERFKAIENQINVVHVVIPDPVAMKPAVEVVAAFDKLYKQTGFITCLTSGKTINCADFPPPCVAILDPFTLYALEGIRTIATPAQVPVIAWVTGSAGAVMMLWGPEEYGGRGDFPARLEEEMKKGSSEIDALNSRAVLGPHDDILQIPGYPIMYDYERNPQKVPEHNRAAHAMFLNIAYQFMKASDGVITVSSPVLEKECVEACDDFFASMGKTHFSIGPLSVIPTPSNKGDAVTEEVLSFLEKAIEEFGEKSVLYISFGTFWWPGEPSIFSAIVDQLIETKTPFILAHPSPVNQPAADLLEKIRGYPHGIDVVWASQEKILSHPATGWFLTHAGWNSIQEAFTYKTPLILWPTGADQPLNASLLSVKYQAAFELLEVRTGEHGRKKPYRCGDGPTPKFTVESAKEEFGRVLKDSKEEQGAAVRKNFEKLAMKVGKVWDEGGDARKGLETFLRKYVD